MDHHYYGMLIVWIGGLILLGLVIFIVIYVVNRQRPWGGPDERHPPTPLDILKERYAKGELTREEYEQRKRDIES